jgi:hypothetical protein
MHSMQKRSSPLDSHPMSLTFDTLAAASIPESIKVNLSDTMENGSVEFDKYPD